MSLYTKNGKPLRLSGKTVYSKSGAVVGRVKGNKVYGPNGRYVGTVTNGRLVFRSTDSAGTSSSFAAAPKVASAQSNGVSSVTWGEEPNIPN